jgi:hypothetical protein
MNLRKKFKYNSFYISKLYFISKLKFAHVKKNKYF